MSNAYYYHLEDRFSVIEPYVRGKEVLDIGCCGGKLDRPKGLQYEKIRPLAKYILGIDVNRPFLAEMKKKGYNVKFADAEDFDLKRKFDVIVAGDIIEHIANHGKFLECCRRHLKRGGRLIITTPNPFYIMNTLLITFKKDASVNHDHTSWFGEYVMKTLLARFAFDVEKIVYTNPYMHDMPGNKPTHLAVKLLLRFFPVREKLRNKTIIAIARLG
jgi:2-polyprenyl-3-methyl-5-hydroxy-6-metoxy-1,4-benzoquinol methylase